MPLDLPPVALALLEQAGGKVDASLRATAPQLVATRILLHQRLFDLRSEEHAGLRGRELGLPEVLEASGPDWRFYADAAGTRIVAEDLKGERTWVPSL